MSEKAGPFEVKGIRVNIANAPPVYAPGGPVALVFEASNEVDAATFHEIEAEAARRGAVLLVVQCLIVAASLETLLTKIGYSYASSWYFGTTGIKTSADPLTGVRAAAADDVPRMLEIGERKREQYETFSPVFWKKAPTPRDEFAPYLNLQVQSDDNIALVHEVDGTIRGCLIAQCRNLAEGYVDDFAVADPSTDWPVSGVALLSEASRRAEQKGVGTLSIVAGHADTPKRAAVEGLGFTLRKNWLVKTLVARQIFR